jgi:hypothetical protein
VRVGGDTSPLRRSKKKQAFPSARQASCAGLKRQFYAAHQRDLVDYDYEGRLSPKERTWLAAFTEEFYRGWRLKSETQLHPVGQIREADAARSRARRALRGGSGVRLEPLTSALQLRAEAPTESEIVQAHDLAAARVERSAVPRRPFPRRTP